MSRQTQAAAAAFALALTMAAPMAAQAAEKLVVVRDAETGQLRAPTSVEIDALKKAEARMRASGQSKTLVAVPAGIETRYADGAVSRTLGDDDLMSSVAVRNADGTTTLQCLPTAQAEKIARNPKAASSLKPTNKNTDKAGHELF